MKERFSKVSQRKLYVSACHFLLYISFAVIWDLQVKFACVMCSLKPLAFCTHHNFKNIQKRPINSSRGKMPGKIIILIPKVFLRPLNSFEIIFRQKDINCTAVGNPGAEVQDKCLFIHFYQSKFFAYGRCQCILHFRFKTTEWGGNLLFVHWKLA